VAGAETQIGSSTAGLRFLALAAALTPLPANAGAWIAPEGGQEIITSAIGQRNEMNFYETSSYWEVPLGDENSLVITPWLEQNYDTIDGWRGEAVVGLKHAFYRREDSVVAVQAGALWISHPGSECGEGGGELRVLAGTAFSNGAFLNAEVATRALDGGCGGERLDFTAGYRMGENWLGMAQMFVDAPRDGEEFVKVQLSLVRFGESGRGIQVGVRARVDGSEEPALVLSWWGRPGD
jgi:hypothetical protein